MEKSAAIETGWYLHDAMYVIHDYIMSPQLQAVTKRRMIW